MDLKLKGKTALVAASSEGIGKACALQLAAEGCCVVCCARTEEKLNATVAELRSLTHHNIMGIVADVTNPNNITELVHKAFDYFGSLDVLVNNAGGPPVGSLMTLNDADWEAAYQLTLMSNIRLSRAVLPYMREREWGRIINITSISVKQPIPDLMLSNSFRLAVVGMAKTMASEVGKFNITVNTVAPGFTMTERLLSLFDSRAKKANITRDAVIAEITKEIPLKKLAEPKDIANVVAFLASEQAGYITGTVIPVDGGYIKGV